MTHFPKACAGFLICAVLAVGFAHGAGPAVTNQIRPWAEYRTIMWISDSAYQDTGTIPLFFLRLREMGINTAMAFCDEKVDPILQARFPYYVENMINRGLCLKLTPRLRDWDEFVALWAKAGRPEESFERDFCLDDAQWREWMRKEMQRVVKKHQPNQPVAYDIRDEVSVTVSTNPFDFDFNPIALKGFRNWLKKQYPSLEALNAKWETAFGSWDDVQPLSTDRIKARMSTGEAATGLPDWPVFQTLKFELAEAKKSPTRWNFAPWVDFRTYMDISLASTLDDVRKAAHELDPQTPVGIEGTQMPHAFGGYDLWRLSQALDWVEPYDIGNAREILGSFMPGKTFMTTVSESDANQVRRRLWHLLLEGDRGCIVWKSEDCVESKTDGRVLTSKAKALMPVLKEMTNSLAKVFMYAHREHDPIAIHHSQPSIQVDWLMESMPDGPGWHRRSASHEAESNRMAKVRNSWLKAFQDLGYSPRFVSAAQIENGELKRGNYRVLVMPETWAMSDGELKEVGTFIQGPGTGSVQHAVFCDGTPGMFDGHGTLRATNSLEKFFPPAMSWSRSHVTVGGKARPPKEGDISEYAKQRLAAEPPMEWLAWIAANCPVKPGVVVRGVAGEAGGAGSEVQLPRVRVFRYRVGNMKLVAVERNIEYRMNRDLKHAGGNQNLEVPAEVEAVLGQPQHIYDLRGPKYIGESDRIRFKLDPWQPSLFLLVSGRQVSAAGLVPHLLNQLGP